MRNDRRKAYGLPDIGYKNYATMVISNYLDSGWGLLDVIFDAVPTNTERALGQIVRDVVYESLEEHMDALTDVDYGPGEVIKKVFMREFKDVDWYTLADQISEVYWDEHGMEEEGPEEESDYGGPND